MKKINYCCDFLKKFDYYGLRPSLYFEGESVKGTNFGCLLTSLLCILSIICLFYFGQNLFYRRRPFISYHDEYDPLPEPFVLNPEYYPLLIELNSETGEYLTDSRLFIPKISQSAYKNQKKIYSQYYFMEICNETHISNLDEESKQYFRIKNLSNFFCIPKNIKNLTMEGAYDQEVFKTIKITFSLCKSEDICFNSSYIQEVLKTGYIGIYFVDTAVDPGNFENPKKRIPKEVFTNFVVKSQKEVDIYFKNNYLYSEQGLIFDESVDTKMVSYEEFQDLNFMVENDDFLKIYLKIKQMKSIYERNYSKIQDLLGLLGGFLNFFYILGFLLNALYTKIHFITDILLDIFTIKISITKDSHSHAMNALNECIDEKIRIEAPSPIKLVPLENQIENETPLSTERQRLNSETANITLKKFLECENLQKNQELKPSLTFNLDLNNENDKENFKTVKLSPKVIVDQEDLDFGKSEEEEKVREFESKNFKSKSEIIKDLNLQTQIINPPPEIQEIKSLNMSFLDYIYYYTGFFHSPEREKKKLMINKGMQIFEKFLDVKFIIQKFYELEKIKQIVLSDTELDLFNILPKPEIVVNYKEAKDGKIRKKHSVHTRVFMRSNSLEEARVHKMSDQDKRTILMNSVNKRNNFSKKITTFMENKN